MTQSRKRILALALSVLALAAGPTSAQDDPTAQAQADGPGATPPRPGARQIRQVGPETKLPLPRFVSMKSDRANVRRGPSKTHRIDWEFVRRDMPVEVVAEYGHWRQIRDRDGVGGWVHYVLLSGNRTALVEDDMLALRFQPDPDARVVARLEAGVIAELGTCQVDWCRLSVNGYRGWAPKTGFWGAYPDEIRD